MRESRTIKIKVGITNKEGLTYSEHELDEFVILVGAGRREALRYWLRTIGESVIDRFLHQIDQDESSLTKREGE